MTVTDMHVFVTGASGWIGSAVVPELLAAGHTVSGLARSDASAAALTRAGVRPVRGTLADTATLAEAAAAADGVIHLAFIHDFSDYAGAIGADQGAIAAFGDALAGTGKPLVIASGLAGLAPGRVATEADMPGPDAPRGASERAALALAGRGVRAASVRLAPTVHGAGDHGFVATLTALARERGVAGYVGDGANRWPAVHRADAARLFRLALEGAPAGAVLHGAAEEGVPARAIAEAIGRGVGVPAASIDPAGAAEHFAWLGAFFAADIPASSAQTRARLGWEPTGPTLLEDLDAGSYFAAGVA